MSGGGRYLVRPGGRLSGTLFVPGDKSISHRALMLGAIADGTSVIEGLLPGEDVLATWRALAALGVAIERVDADRVQVHGRGPQGLSAPAAPLDLGNSGTSMRLLAGLLAGAGVSATLVGDASLMRRPMRRVVEPLAAMGAAIEASGEGTAPLRITGGRPLHGIDYRLPVASAQVKSALLLAGLAARGTTCVHEPAPSRDHTERMLATLGARLERGGGRVCLAGGQRLTAAELRVPGDFSSAAFFLVAASIAPGSRLTLRDVGINPTRTGLLDILRAMGARIRIDNRRHWGAEPVADLHVEAAPLRGTQVGGEVVPRAIDELPALFVAAACASGETVVRDAAELRHKESDRIAAAAEGLRALGVDAESLEDGMRIVGGGIRGGRVHSHADHRLAMAFAVAALAAAGPVEVLDTRNVATSFPDFAARARAAGLRLEERP